MIVQCPSCNTRFKYPDDRFKEGGKARCGVCKHVFVLTRNETPASKGAQAAEPDVEALARQALERAKEFAAPAEAQVPSPAQTSAQSPEDEAAAKAEKDALFNLDLKKGGEPQGGKKDESKKLKKGPLILAGLLLVGIAVAFVVYFPDLLPGAKKAPVNATSATPEKTEPAKPDPSKPRSDNTTEFLKNFELKDVKQFFVKNDKVGEIMIMQGKVVNKSSSPKELIKVEGVLFDEQGKPIMERRRLAGNWMSIFSLQTLPEAEIEKQLDDQVGVLTNNTNIQPGGETPFQIVFFRYPKEAAEFAIKVVEGREPPQPSK